MARVLRALIIGPPGGGKGTISKWLVRDFGFNHLSSGDALRQLIQAESPLSKEIRSYMEKGALVPDHLVTDMMIQEVKNVGDSDPWLLDGVPRTINQAHDIDKELEINAVINLDIPEEEILSRLSGRRVHVASGRSYHIAWSPPKVEGLDDETGEPLIQRPDDTEEAIRDRLLTFNEITKPILDHYDAKNVLMSFSGTESKVLYPLITEKLNGLMGQ